MTHRKLIICNDGTWNTPDDEDRGKRAPTNITKISRGLLPVDSQGISQIVYYDEGVGTGFADRLVAGITGLGLSQNVIQAYRFISTNYQEGDEIFLFGFSRGAYTSRSLCGLLNHVGLVAKDDIYYLNELYHFYKTGASKSEVEAFYQTKNLRQFKPRIKFIGVFDTVGALGIPLQGVNKLLSSTKLVEFQFHDVSLSPIVDYAYQALGIDELRGPFTPSLWSGKTEQTIDMEQRWFTGVHSNIGGGYHPDGLANNALNYIVSRAEHCGLEFDYSNYLQFYKGSWDSELRDSMTLKYRFFGKHPRPISLNDKSCQVIDSSVFERINNDPKYRPGNLPAQSRSASIE